jgi:hypothetical protein
MKNLIKSSLFFVLIAAAFSSCKKDETQLVYLGGTNPVLNATTNATPTSINLNNAIKTTTALTLNWTNPNFQFSTGISSQDVTYQVEIDTTGANFTNPLKQTVSVSKDLSISFTVDVFNGYLLNQLSLDTVHTHSLDIRVKAILASSSVTLISNVVKLTTKPYPIPPVVAPPSSGQLFLVGSATAGGWNNPVPVPTQQFTKVSTTLYRITVALTGGQEYLFIPVNGDWSHKYACHAASTVNTGGDFGYDWSDNFPGPTASGTYTITVDFQKGKFSVQ